MRAKLEAETEEEEWQKFPQNNNLDLTLAYLALAMPSLAINYHLACDGCFKIQRK